MDGMLDRSKVYPDYSNSASPALPKDTSFGALTFIAITALGINRLHSS
jgi:hypothetical protein